MGKQQPEALGNETRLNSYVQERARAFVAKRKELTPEVENKIRALRFVASFDEYLSVAEEFYSIKIPRWLRIKIKVLNIWTMGFFNVLQNGDDKVPVIFVKNFSALDHELQHFFEFFIEGQDKQAAFQDTKLIFRIYGLAFLEMVAVGAISLAGGVKVVLIDGILQGNLENSRMNPEQASLLMLATLLSGSAWVVSGMAYKRHAHEKRADGRGE